MNVENRVRPDPSAITPFIETEGTVCMVNLLKVNEQAEYADGRESTGKFSDAWLTR